MQNEKINMNSSENKVCDPLAQHKLCELDDMLWSFRYAQASACKR